jgi:hypothetical protein
MLISIVIHPETGEITGLVIKDKTVSKPYAWLVPIERVLVSTPRMIKLDCTRENITGMQPFIPEHYLEREFDPYGYAFNLPMIIAPDWITSQPCAQTREKLTLYRGMVIQAVDDCIGQAGEFLIDPQTKVITHIVLQRGPLGDKNDIIIPLSLISQVEGEKIYLKLEKNAVETMTTPLLKRPWKEVFQSDLDLFMWTFATKVLADAALKTLRAYQENNRILPIKIALITSDFDGHITLREITEVNAQMDDPSHMINGGLVNILYGPDGHFASLRQETPAEITPDQEFSIKDSNGMVKDFGQEIPRGGGAIVLITQHRWYSEVRQIMTRFDHFFFHQRLTDVAAIDSNPLGTN